MTVKERALLVTKRLDEFYTTELTCYLNHDSAWQLLFATILSAQCTDARVNIVTEKLFKKYRTLEDFSKADIKELEEDIRSTGFTTIKQEILRLVPRNFWNAIMGKYQETSKALRH